MKNYQIMTDSASDLTPEYVEKNNVTVLSLKYYFGDEEYTNYLDYRDLSAKKFYDKLREKEIPKTSQVNIEQFKAGYEKILKEGKDILVVTLSSGISGTYNSAKMAKKEMLEKYPERKIFVVDSKSASLGVGLIVNKAVKLRDAGISIEEAFKEVEEFVPHVANVFTVDDLTYLRDGGRISGIVYLLGTTLRIKPILAASDEGEIKLRTNSFGRRKSLNSLVKRVVTTYEPNYGKEIFISHGDCLEDAIYVKNAIEKELNLEIDLINVMGPVTGTHGGPGILAVFYPVESR